MIARTAASTAFGKVRAASHRYGRFWQLLLGGMCLPIAARAQDPVRDSAAPAPPAQVVPAVPQRDIPDVVRRLLGRKPAAPKDSTPGRRKLTKAILPIIGNNPNYGSYFGGSIVASGWLGDPATTSLTSATLSGWYATEGYTGFTFRSSFSSSGNRGLWKSDWRYFDGGQVTYGLGPATSDQEQATMTFVLYRFHQTIYHRTKSRSVYVGLGYYFDRYAEIKDLDAGGAQPTPYEQYTGGASPSQTTSSGFTAEVLHDSRDNPINATRGAYWNGSLGFFPTGLGSDDNWQRMWSDLRLYPRVPGGTLAIWSYLWFTFGDTPYLDLPANGWDVNGRASRGYLQGRIRGRSQVYTEFEYRRSLTQDGLLGAVGFLNLMATTVDGSGVLGTLDPGYGVGLRVKFDKKTATNLYMDYGRDHFGDGRLYLGLQETF